MSFLKRLTTRWSQMCVLIALGISLSTAAATRAQSAPVIQERIAQWHGPELRTRCANWLRINRPWGGQWKFCVGHNYQFMRHTLILEVHGLESGSLDSHLREAVNAAVAAAIAAFVLTPSPEPGVRSAAAIVAARAAFAARLGALAARFNLGIVHRREW